MATFTQNIKKSEESLEISKNLLWKAVHEEQEAIEKLGSDEMLMAYKIKKQNRPLIESLLKSIDEIIKKMDEKYQEKANYSCFYVYNIGPALARLFSRMEDTNYTYQTINYHGSKTYQGHYDYETVPYNGICFVVSSNNYLKDNNGQLIEKEEIGEFCRNKDTICLATGGFELPRIVYKEKVYSIPGTKNQDALVEFYDNQNNQKMLFENHPYVYDFIDRVIDKKYELKRGYLTSSEYDELIDSFVKENKLDELSLKRTNDDK